MGAANSVEVPGGGTEGYHVLRVSINCPNWNWNEIKWTKEKERVYK